jgi:hypothetical protein
MLGSNVRKWNKTYFDYHTKSATWYNAISSQHSTAMSLRKQPTGSLGSDRYVEMSGGPHETDETLMRASNK